MVKIIEKKIKIKLISKKEFIEKIKNLIVNVVGIIVLVAKQDI